MDVLNPEYRLFLRCAQKFNLRYLLIGGYAVNFHGYIRNTDDMDIWLAPKNENRDAFISTLLCMGYSERQIAPLREKDFSHYFVGTIGPDSDRIDVITIVHRDISYEEAEKHRINFEIEVDLFIPIVPYYALKDMKLRSSRPKDLWDIARLEELRKKL